MTDTALAASDWSKFDEAVAFCRQLRDKKMLGSGVETFVMDDGRIATRPVPPKLQPGESTTDVASTIRESLGIFQELRAVLARGFDIESSAWNESNIGKALWLIDRDFRAETYKVENAAKAQGNNDVYNMLTIIALSESVIELFTLVLSESFNRKSRPQMLQALNEFGAEFLHRMNRLRAHQGASAIAEVLIAVDDVLKSGRNPGIESFVSAILVGGTLETLRKHFEKMLQAS